MPHPDCRAAAVEAKEDWRGGEGCWGTIEAIVYEAKIHVGNSLHEEAVGGDDMDTRRPWESTPHGL